MRESHKIKTEKNVDRQHFVKYIVFLACNFERILTRHGFSEHYHYHNYGGNGDPSVFPVAAPFAG
jgi:hypothetical protein